MAAWIAHEQMQRMYAKQAEYDKLRAQRLWGGFLVGRNVAGLGLAAGDFWKKAGGDGIPEDYERIGIPSLVALIRQGYVHSDLQSYDVALDRREWRPRAVR